jgi:hypothetical protein
MDPNRVMQRRIHPEPSVRRDEIAGRTARNGSQAFLTRTRWE